LERRGNRPFEALEQCTHKYRSASRQEIKRDARFSLLTWRLAHFRIAHCRFADLGKREFGMSEGTLGACCDFCVVARCLSAETSRLK
jgi:hypothetical protein